MLKYLIPGLAETKNTMLGRKGTLNIFSDSTLREWIPQIPQGFGKRLHVFISDEGNVQSNDLFG